MIDPNRVNRLVHSIWPHFKRADLEESKHAVEYIVVVLFGCDPLSIHCCILCHLSDIINNGNHIRPNAVGFQLNGLIRVIAIRNCSFEHLNSQNPEDKQEQENDEHDVHQRRYRLEQRIYHSLDPFVLANHPQWPEGSECSEAFHELQV